MSKIGDYCASQCGNPRGVIGKIMTWGMNRANSVMYHGIVQNMNLSGNKAHLQNKTACVSSLKMIFFS